MLESALAAPPGQRDGLIAQRCGADAELRAAVCDLLAAECADGSFLDAPAPGAALDLALMSAAQDALHTHAGPYQLTALVATGGMGVVYRAVRDDGEYHKQVAVKLIRGGLAGHDVLRRFQRERQVLANLDHPNITRLLDGGAAADGRPYLVMEFVDGQPIDRYCRERRLDRSQRLRLFREVCLAVHYAHQNLVVHRDLKPANILITPEGRPKLLDFGIAKLLEPAPARTGHTTEPAGAARTLPFCSPEQIRGGPITTAADVYALGVVLYELLAGRCPWDVSKLSRYEAERCVCESDPPPMSAAARIQRATSGADAAAAPAGLLPRELSGDLDRIVAMAMHKEPPRRYGSAEQLAEDIRRYLEGEPVLAHPPGRLYRLGKLVRRHWPSSIAALTALTLILGLSITSLLMARRALSAADSERQARRTAEQLNGFVDQVLSSANPTRLGADANLRQLLEDASARVNTQLSAFPVVAAGVHVTLGITYRQLQELALAEQHLRTALQYYRRAPQESCAAELATCLIRLGSILTYRDAPEALDLQREALAIRRRLFGDEHPSVAESLHALGFALSRCTQPPQYAEARQCYEESEKLEQRLYGAGHSSQPGRQHAMAALLRHEGRLGDAADLYRHARAAARERYGEDAPIELELSSDYARVLGEMGRLSEAESTWRALVPVYRRQLGETLTLIPRCKLAQLALRRGRTLQAEADYRRMLAELLRWSAPRQPEMESTLIGAALLLEDPLTENPGAGWERIMSLGAGFGAAVQMELSAYWSMVMGLAECEAHVGRRGLAEELARESARLLRETHPENPIYCVEGEVRLASVLARCGKFAESRELLNAGYALLVRRRGVEHPEAEDARGRLAEAALLWAQVARPGM